MLVLLFLEAAAVPTAFTSSNTLRTAFADWCDASKRGSTEAAHGPISDWDVSGVNSLYELYSAVPQTHRHTCNPDISRWDVSNVINMRSAFQDAQSFNQDLSNWNVGKVTNLNRFMAGARAFNQDISGWNVANVEDMDYVFQSAWAFNQDISGWDVGKVTRMDGPFRDTPALDNCNKKAISIAFSTATGAWPGEHSGFATLDCFYPPPTAPPSLPPTLPPSSPPPPLTGLHLKEDAAKVHFGQNMECTLELKPGPPPYLESNCPIDSPPPQPPPLPSQPPWPPPRRPPACPWEHCAVEALNLGAVDSNLKGGFYGGFATSTHAYYVPYYNGDWALSGYAARVSLSDFTASGVEQLNLASVDSNLKGFQGGFATSTHAYYMPYKNDGGRSGYAARVSLSDFTASGVEILNLASVNSNLKGFNGGFATSTHAYYVPHQNDGGYHGYTARVSLSDFTASGVEVLNLESVNSNLKGFVGGFATSTHAYYVPYYDGGAIHGYAVRVSLSDFTASSVEVLNLESVNSNLKGFMGGFATSTHAYYVPGSSLGFAVRVSLSDFTASGVEVLNLASVNSNLKGLHFGFATSTHAYYVPHYADGVYLGYTARVLLSDFTASGVEVLNLESVNSNLKGFVGGFATSAHTYYVPYYNGALSGYAARVSLSI